MSMFVLSIVGCSGENNDKKGDGDSSNKDIQAILEITGEGGITICDCMVGQEPDLNLATNKEEHDSIFELYAIFQKYDLQYKVRVFIMISLIKSLA